MTPNIKYIQEKAGLFNRENLDLRVKYVMALRDVIGRRCPKNKVGNPVVSDIDVILGVSDEEHLEVLTKLKLV